MKSELVAAQGSSQAPRSRLRSAVGNMMSSAARAAKQGLLQRTGMEGIEARGFWVFGPTGLHHGKTLTLHLPGE